MLIYRPYNGATDSNFVEDLFRRDGLIPPNPNLMGGVVATHNDQIVGYWGMTILAHAGPLWIHPDFRGLGMWRKLNRTLDEKIPKGSSYYSFTDRAQTAHIFEQVGMQDSGFKVYRKVF